MSFHDEPSLGELVRGVFVGQWLPSGVAVLVEHRLSLLRDEVKVGLFNDLALFAAPVRGDPTGNLRPELATGFGPSLHAEWRSTERRRYEARVLTALLLSTLAQPAGLDRATAWEKVSVEGALTLERRAVPASSTYEYRVLTRTDVPVAALCEGVFEWGTRGKDVPGLKARQELSAAADERVIYDQFEQPVVSNRDYAMTVRRTREGERCRIRFWVSNEKAPKRPEGWVRLDKLWGSWSFTPRDGQTDLVYTLFADPGGSVPAFLVHGSQRETALQSVRQALEKGRAAQGVK